MCFARNGHRLNQMPSPAKQHASRPLSRCRILVGRARHQASALSAGLHKLGAYVLEIPFIEIRKPRSYAPLDSALKNIDSYDWLILTSVNGVEAFWERARRLRVGRNSMRHLQVAAIGPATQKAIEERGLKVHVVPQQYVAESVVKSLQLESEREARPARPRQSRPRRDSTRTAQAGRQGGCRRSLRNRRSQVVENALAGCAQ